MATTRTLLRRAVVLVGAIFLLPLAAEATEVEGGGTPTSDCWVTFDSPAVNFPVSKPTSVRCADQDSGCGDADTRVGYCGYSVNLILNSSHFNPPCAPADLSQNRFLIPYTEPTNDDHPLHVDDFKVFQDFATTAIPSLTASHTDVMSGPNPVTVPLRIAFTTKGPVFKTTTLTLRTTMCTVGIKGETTCPTLPKDIDNFKLTCTPPIDTMTGQPMSACIGADGNPLSGTFQQIEEHILDRKCSNLGACHNPGPPNLCLNSAGCGSASPYTDLVSQLPTNPSARADGLLRVDPSNPTNSLIVHKIHGGSQLNSMSGVVGAYGLRMPYNNPAIGKSRPKLSSAEIQLITDWIAAGAPMTGFVSTAPGACH